MELHRRPVCSELIGAPQTHSAGVVEHRQHLQKQVPCTVAAPPRSQLLTRLSADVQSRGSKMCCRAGAGGAEATDVVGPREDRPQPPRSGRGLNSSLAGHRRRPAPGRTMRLVATLLLCVATAVARLELASDTPTSISTKLEEQSFLHAELAIATRSMPTRRRGLRPKRC